MQSTETMEEEVAGGIHLLRLCSYWMFSLKEHTGQSETSGIFSLTN